uniref:Disease resistance N-terminal domain-containing protein n=1 Tax=Chenopodium quinoa TaxID=63459 RepID=A0A803MLP9_CHEQI
MDRDEKLRGRRTLIFNYRSHTRIVEVLLRKSYCSSIEAKQELLDEEQHYVEELEDVVYEADDLLDEFITLIEQKKIRQ